MAKRPSIDKRVDLHDECDAHGDDIPQAAVGMRPSRPPAARISRPPQPPAAAESPTTGFIGKTLDDAVQAALETPDKPRTQVGGF